MTGSVFIATASTPLVLRRPRVDTVQADGFEQLPYQVLEFRGREVHQHGTAVQAGHDIHAVHQPVLAQVEGDQRAHRLELVRIRRDQRPQPLQAGLRIDLGQHQFTELFPSRLESDQTGVHLAARGAVDGRHVPVQRDRPHHPVGVRREQLVDGPQRRLRQHGRVQLMALLLGPRDRGDLVAGLHIPVGTGRWDHVFQRQVDLDQQVSRVRLVGDLVRLREAVGIGGCGQDLVDEPLDRLDVAVPTGGAACLDPGVPLFDASRLLLVALVMAGLRRIQFPDALVLLARMVPQRLVEPLARGLHLRVVRTTPEAERSQPSARRLGLVLSPPREGNGLRAALGRREDGRDEVLPEAVEAQGPTVQHRRAQQSRQLLDVMLGHARPVDGLLGTRGLVGGLLLTRLAFGLRISGLPQPLTLPGLPRPLARVLVAPTRHRHPQVPARPSGQNFPHPGSYNPPAHPRDHSRSPQPLAPRERSPQGLVD
ncbi:hypothetical protein OG749_39990 [Streptomyces nojiriensis]|uniref:hypothetical protein n=1 Tax=Streptomyces nojiriensis TaxID=66374 RepID=UPI002E18465C